MCGKNECKECNEVCVCVYGRSWNKCVRVCVYVSVWEELSN